MAIMACINLPKFKITRQRYLYTNIPYLEYNNEIACKVNTDESYVMLFTLLVIILFGDEIDYGTGDDIITKQILSITF